MGATRVKVKDCFRWLIGRQYGWQFGEQGVLDAIVGSLPDIPKTCVEFGAGDGGELPLTCQRLIDAGWSARLYECDSAKADALEKWLGGKTGAVVVREKVTEDTVRNGSPFDCGVCVVDVDGREFPIVEAMKATPCVLVVEHWDEIDPTNPYRACVPTNLGEIPKGTEFVSQANSPAVAQLLADRGYELVWAGRVNGIYVRDDLWRKLRKDPVTVAAGATCLYLCDEQIGLEGYTRIASASEAYPLAYADGSVDEIRSVNMLDRFPIDDTAAVLADWIRVLKPGGRIRLTVPDIVAMAKEVVEPQGRFDVTRGIYGNQRFGNDFRKCGFDEAGLFVDMQRAGLIALNRWRDTIPDQHQHPASLNLEGYKPTPAMRDAAFLRKIRCVQSVPRLCFTDTVVALLGLIRSLGIDVHTMQGAFWGQCMERGFKAAIRHGAEWILTVDYDTIFTASDVQKMCMLMEANPDVGALAPVQLKRGDDAPILNVLEDRKDLALLRGPLMDASLAHFGLTLIRVSALEKMKHPWFIGKPNADGEWEDNRLDDDIHFWHKFREAGNRLCIAPRICVGHSQLMITWPDEHLRPIRQHVHDWHENGAPKNRRC